MRQTPARYAKKIVSELEFSSEIMEQATDFYIKKVSFLAQNTRENERFCDIHFPKTSMYESLKLFGIEYLYIQTKHLDEKINNH